MAPYIRETIESVLSQKGSFEIEYIIMDGGSTDGTVEILKKYEQLLNEKKYPIKCTRITFKWQSEKDGGMYDAINKGFARATGDVYAWINADDTYLPDAFHRVANALTAFPEIEWIKGITSNIEADGTVIRRGEVRIYEQKWLARGMYGRQSYFVEQDSVFWRANLWKKIGNIPTQYRLAGDYWLWIQFACFAPLWSFNIPVSRFRKRKEQLGQQVSAYKKEQVTILPKTGYEFSLVRLFFTLQSRLAPHFQRFFLLLYPFLFMKGKKTYYIDIVDDKMVEKEATSYLMR